MKYISSIKKEWLLLLCVLLVVATICIFLVGWIWNLISFLCFLGFILIFFQLLRRQQHEFEQRMEQSLLQAKSMTQQLLMELLLPCMVTNSEGRIEWFNLEMGNLFPGRQLIGQPITELLVEADKWEKSDVMGEIRIQDKTYSVLVQTLEGIYDAKSYLFLDVTQERELKARYDGERFAAGSITVDNYSDVMSGMTDGEQNKLVMELESVLYHWAAPLEGMIRRMERDRFLLLLNQEHLNQLMNQKFAILNEVKQIKGKGGIGVTLSIGIGSHQSSVGETVSAAQAALELALGRGGDQAVVKQEDQFLFFGGNSREVERRTSVRARVIAQALYGLMENAPDIIIMGHKNPDADCVGAALGVCAIARHLEKPVRVVLGECNSSVKKLLNGLKQDLPPVWIQPMQAKHFIHQNTLVVVVDIHRPSLVECPELIERSSQVVIIDHHRRSADFIEKPVLQYQEPYASSTSEMVTEILQYIGNGIKLSRAEAEALLSGIVLDTKNFTVKTNVRTFDAASYLRRQGADPIRVQTMFSTDMETYIKIAGAVEQAEIFHSQYAIAHCFPGKDDLQIMAMIADELLTIEGIGASFVLCHHEGHVHISARSRGLVNVQRVMEHVSGGGHQTSAGAKLEGIELEQAKEKVMQLIEAYEQEKGQ